MITQTPFVILSAERAAYDEAVNIKRTADLLAQVGARALDCAPVLGAYDGTLERSILILCDQGEDDAAYSDALRLAARYGQDTVLYVDANRRGLLVRPKTGAIVAVLGAWRQVPAIEARRHAAYTFTQDGAYYVCGG